MYQNNAPVFLETVPTETGVYHMTCAETDHVEESVMVWRDANGVLVATDPHLGAMPVEVLHNGLTSVKWAVIRPMYKNL